MSATWAGRPIDIRRADSVTDVLHVLNDATGWLAARRLEQWPKAFHAEFLQPSITAGDTWLALVDGQISATVTLTWTDPLWVPDDGRAGYLHRLAVRRGAAGLGASVLQWTAEQTIRAGRSLLRLDCVAANARLRSYYESAGFHHRDDIREDCAPYALLSRYEKSLR